MSEPIAYFITWSCKGSRLHGDPRGSVDMQHNVYGEEFVPPEPSRHDRERANLKGGPLILTTAQRRLVLQTLREVAEHRGWELIAEAVRTTHIHVVVAAPEHTPERVMEDLKAWCTRRLRDAGLIARDAKPWTRHGSTRYVWKPDGLAEAVDYVREMQDVPRER